MGVSYQKGFGKFRELLRSLFGPNDTEETPNTATKEQTIIRIENDKIQRETVSDTGAAGR